VVVPRRVPGKLGARGRRRIRFRSYLSRRAAPGTVSQAHANERRRGYRESNGIRANVRGSLASQGARGFKRARRRSRGSCPYVVVSLQMSIGGSAQRSPSPQTQTPERACGDAVNGGLAFGCINRAKSRSALSGRALLVRSSLLRSYAWQGEPEATKESSNRSAGCATPREAAWGQLGFRDAKSAEEPRARGRVRNRRSRGRRKSSASLVEGRRPGPGKASSRHGGEVEAVSAVFTESARRAPRKCAHRYRVGIATGASEARLRVHVVPVTTGMGRTLPHEARAARRSDRCAVKRTVLQSWWAASR
jgi:hypothetical protein